MPTRSMTVRTLLAAAAGVVVLACSGAAAASPAQEPPPPKPPAAGPPAPTILPTVREAAVGLPGHTVYRPADLKALRKASLPVIVYGNGACASSNLEGITFLTGLASQGYIVVANGGLDEFPVPNTPENTIAHPEALLAAAHWATESGQARKQFDGRADTTRVGVLGHSCGGVEALAAGTDPLIDAVAGFNTGYFEEPVFGGYGRDRLADLHTPTLLVNGGPDDVAYHNSIDNYALLDVPAALVGDTAAGHTGLIAGSRPPRAGRWPPTGSTTSCAETGPPGRASSAPAADCAPRTDGRPSRRDCRCDAP
ncbi:poly(ethylene terephthalate) hydrolase family protein [Microbispora bryophytorum]|uniref:poly(ethylene terephthalate) hydrolase family protein n=1 Tax=Microbispora bryophytorum TaxID=1460882 RepID=UPI0034118711